MPTIAALSESVTDEERGAAVREPRARRGLRLRERGREVGGHAHHLAGRAHLRAEQRVGAGEAVEREHRLLDRDVRARGVLGQVQLARAARRASPGTRAWPAAARSPWRRTARSATRAGWPRSRRASSPSTANCTLISPTMPSASAMSRVARADLVEHLGAERVRRQHAGRVARVDAGLLDVLHDRRRSSTSSPSQSASTSTSIASSRKRSRKISRAGVGRRPERAQVVARGLGRVDDLHRAAAEHVARAHEQREADLGAPRPAPPRRECAVAYGGALRPSSLEQRAEAPAVLGEVDRVDAGCRAAARRPREPGGELERRLAAELDDHALGLLDLADAEHVLERQRLEVEAVGRVVVGRDGLGVAVDHHRVAARLAHGHRGVHAAVVELDPLADAVGPGAEDHHARRVAADDLVRGRRSRSQAGVVVGRRASNSAAQVSTDLVGALAGDRRRRGRARARCSSRRNQGSMPVRAWISSASTPRRSASRIDVVAVGGRASRSAVEQLARRQPVGVGGASSSRERIALANACWKVRPIAITSPTRLHVRGELGVGARELLEREARPLDDDVVDRRLEARRRAPRDVVGDLVERVADREARGDLGDREARSPSRRAREERDTRGFISMTTISSVSGLTANCTLEPPVSTPTARITAIAWSRSFW